MEQMEHNTFSPEQEQFDEYERLQIDLMSEEDSEKRDEIEQKLTALADKLGLTKSEE